MMKKTLKLAAAATMLATPAIADAVNVPYNVLNTNMENPLYMPGRNVFYSKLSNGVMLKVADSSDAHKDKGHDGATEFPIIRIQEHLGYGITDRWTVHGSVQYTHDDDIGRTGLSEGRLGTTYRILNVYNGFVWDVYGDLHLGGLGQMRGQYNLKAGSAGLANATGVIDYDNYSNGMWGYHVGTKFGHVWDRLTVSAFAEVLRTIGDDNSSIRIVGDGTPLDPTKGYLSSTATILAGAGVPSEVAAEFKSTTDVNAGLNAFYQWTSKWSMGSWFRYEHHASQGIKKITTQMPNANVAMLAKGLEQKLADLQDGFDAYVIGLSVAHQFTDHAQVALYGEYTFDTAEPRSQNGTDVKAEAGVRVNFKF